MKRRKLLWAAVTLVLLVLPFWLYFVLFVSLVKVPTGSMKNMILPGDRLAVQRWYGTVNRGDVIMFRYPKDLSIRYIQRVIALPGERIQVKGTRVYINGEELPELHILVEPDDNTSGALREKRAESNGPYRVFDYTRNDGPDFPDFYFTQAHYAIGAELLVPNGEYFVMGDNRDNSHDSRYWGTVKREFIIGKAWFVYWSQSKDESRFRWNRLFTKIR